MNTQRPSRESHRDDEAVPCEADCNTGERMHLAGLGNIILVV
jgi:hypothetical protein